MSKTTQDALYLCPYGNSGRQTVKSELSDIECTDNDQWLNKNTRKLTQEVSLFCANSVTEILMHS